MSKRIILLITICMTIIFNTIPVSADTESSYITIGVKNANNTPDNSAKVKNVLNQPEIGWKRYKYSAPQIQYYGKWEQLYTYYRNINNGSSVKFKFKGDRFRIIGIMWSNTTNNTSVFVDNQLNGNIVSNTSNDPNNHYLLYEVNNLEDKSHTVELKIPDNQKLAITGVDVMTSLETQNQEVSIKLNKDVLNLNKGASEVLQATVFPNDANIKHYFSWESDNENIAKVDAEGKVTAVGLGTTTITAKVTIDGILYKATCNITVTSLDRVILHIFISGNITKEYDLSEQEFEAFLNWYTNRANGKGAATYILQNPGTKGPFKSRNNYVIFDKIQYFEVDTY